MKKPQKTLAAALLALGTLIGCSGDGKGGDLGSNILGAFEQVGGDAGRLVGAVDRTYKAFEKASEQFNAEDEYQIGRAAAANILQRYPVYQDEAANRYVNLIGHTLTEFSTKPEVFAGYHFQILDSSEVNAFATPGSFIFITRGMLRCAESEDELAAVLAHEIAHVQQNHALKSIQSGRWTTFTKTLAVEGAKVAAGTDAQVAELFSNMAGDVGKTLMDTGYSREQEAEADTEGAGIMMRAGYDPSALISVLQKMESRLTPGRNDFTSTHPKPADRIATVKKKIGSPAPQPASAPRQQRFNDALRAARAG